jgi:hypothetical protein
VKKMIQKMYCCDDMRAAIEYGFFVERDDEILINKAKHPLKAGNILTGETYDPKEFVYTMSLRFCPFCSARLRFDD